MGLRPFAWYEALWLPRQRLDVGVGQQAQNEFFTAHLHPVDEAVRRQSRRLGAGLAGIYGATVLDEGLQHVLDIAFHQAVGMGRALFMRQVNAAHVQPDRDGFESVFERLLMGEHNRLGGGPGVVRGDVDEQTAFVAAVTIGLGGGGGESDHQSQHQRQRQDGGF